MLKKRRLRYRLLEALALVGLVFSVVAATGIAAPAATDEPDFLVLNPDRE